MVLMLSREERRWLTVRQIYFDRWKIKDSKAFCELKAHKRYIVWQFVYDLLRGPLEVDGAFFDLFSPHWHPSDDSTRWSLWRHQCLHLLLSSLQDRLHLLIDILASFLCIFCPKGVVLLEQVFKILMAYLQTRQIVLHRARQETFCVLAIMHIGTDLELDCLYFLLYIHQVFINFVLQDAETFHF